jgi:hypothetical protein
MSGRWSMSGRREINGRRTKVSTFGMSKSMSTPFLFTIRIERPPQIFESVIYEVLNSHVPTFPPQGQVSDHLSPYNVYHMVCVEHAAAGWRHNGHTRLAGARPSMPGASRASRSMMRAPAGPGGPRRAPAGLEDGATRTRGEAGRCGPIPDPNPFLLFGIPLECLGNPLLKIPSLTMTSSAKRPRTRAGQRRLAPARA